MIRKFPAVSNFIWLFLKLNRFICKLLQVLPDHRFGHIESVKILVILRPNPHGRQLGPTAMSWTNSIGRNAHLNQYYLSNSLPSIKVASRVGWAS